MILPNRILDLHTHAFNARYLPLESIIADAMGKDSSILANGVAKLLYRITGSSFEDSERMQVDRRRRSKSDDEYHLDVLWEITEYELLQATQLQTALLDARTQSSNLLVMNQAALLSSDLLVIIEELAAIDYSKEAGELKLAEFLEEPTLREQAARESISDLLKYAKRVVKKAFWFVKRLMDPKAWGELENYLEFFVGMLYSEKGMMKRLFDSYGSGVGPLQISHNMMDMQYGYPREKTPYYPFHPVQVQRMQDLQREYPGKVFGLSAFDPRRPDWDDRAKESLQRGLLGFKFYPSMGYKPSGNDVDDKGKVIEERIQDFFTFCVKGDIPLFMHCTPLGFQTRENLGQNADPHFWDPVLSKGEFSNLRLCFGHAGGGIALDKKDDSVISKGWLANSEAEWNHASNYARKVVELCVTYPNVYCELGYILELFDKRGRDTFMLNLERAAKTPGNYKFMKKVAYGTDWHMPQIVDRTREYYYHFVEIFNEFENGVHIDDFFWKTGYRYLKISS